MADPLEPGSSASRTVQNRAASTPIAIPVTAEDVQRRRRRVVLMILAPALVVCAAAGWIYKRSTDPLHAQMSYDASQRLFTAGRYSESIVSLDSAIALKSDFADAYMLRARCRVAQYDSASAIPDFGKAIQLQPRNAQSRLERGLAYYSLKNHQAAIADATAAIAIQPDLAAAYNLRGTASRDMGDPHKALSDFDRAVELAPNADNYFQRGATRQALGQHELAIADFGQAIEYTPDRSHAYYARAESERAIGALEAAKQDHLKGRILDGR